RLAEAYFNTPGVPEVHLRGKTYKLLKSHDVGRSRGRYTIVYNNTDGDFYMCESKYDYANRQTVHNVSGEWISPSAFTNLAQRTMSHNVNNTPVKKASAKASTSMQRKVLNALKRIGEEAGSKSFLSTQSEVANM